MTLTQFKERALEFGPRLLGVFIMSAFMVVALDSELREQARSLFHHKYRVILAVAMADVEGNGQKDQILKIKTDEGLFLEVYAPRNHGDLGLQQELIATAQLPDKRDGYFTFNGEVTNLAVDQLDRSGKPEILASSFDNDLIGHLNVYRYISTQKELELVKLN